MGAGGDYHSLVCADVAVRELVSLIENVPGHTQLPDTPVGRWVTLKNGRKVFIGGPSHPNVHLDALKPKDAGKGVKVSFQRKDGTSGTRYEFPDEWHEQTSRYKFAKVAHIEDNRDQIESGLTEDVNKGLLSGKGLDRNGVTSLCAYLIAKSGMRPGSPGQSTKGEDTFGATILEKRHVSIKGDTVTFKYRGKSGVNQNTSVTDKVIAAGVRSLIGGDKGSGKERLFQHDGTGISANAVGERFRRFNKHYKSKDFRTAVAMQEATDEVAKIIKENKAVHPDPEKAKKEAKKIVKRIGVRVSSKLGNTPSVAISNYTSPALVEYCLAQSGYSRQLLEAVDPHEKSMANTAATRPYTPLNLGLLGALYGRDRVQAWSAGFLSDLDTESADPDMSLIDEPGFADGVIAEIGT